MKEREQKQIAILDNRNLLNGLLDSLGERIKWLIDYRSSYSVGSVEFAQHLSNPSAHICAVFLQAS